ncbi:MAG: DUF2344 domain-containing protein [Lachnospiraceae bacterium]|nr:DUF2344 domain-containing protein [Lachnospiraceae bacterium]
MKIRIKFAKYGTMKFIGHHPLQERDEKERCRTGFKAGHR